MRMMAPHEVPRLKTIGILSGIAILLLAFAAWIIVAGDVGVGMYMFPALLIGIVLLFMALVLLALRVINLREDAPPPGP